MKVEQWCNQMIVATDADAGVQELAELMHKYEVGEVIVIREAGTLITPIGIVTAHDLAARAWCGNAGEEELTAGEVMSGRLLIVRECDELDVALTEMRARGVHRAPVIDEDGALSGILVLQDVLAAMIRLVGDFHIDGYDESAYRDAVPGPGVDERLALTIAARKFFGDSLSNPSPLQRGSSMRSPAAATPVVTI